MLEIIHWLALAIATFTAFIFFRDLGDISQTFMHVRRKDLIYAIRHERRFLLIGFLATGIALVTAVFADAGVAALAYTLVAINSFLLGFPYLWLHYGLRNQQSRARYWSVAEARDYVRDDESVIVIENNGKARAHSDYHIKRPHLAGDAEGLGGEDVIMTYCCMTHLGQGFKPEIEGHKLELEVLAQHGNNLIMRDETTGEPIQQMYGTRERDGRWSERRMPQWPTFRMPFEAFARAYPEGEVFLNKIPPFRSNPLLWLLDHFVEIVFLWATTPHHINDTIMCQSMDVEDDRLRRKQLVWGFNIGGESMAYTEAYIRGKGNLVNARVGGRDIVAAYDVEYSSLNIWYNDSGQAVEHVDFWGGSDQGQLRRVETVKAGLYWFVWINYYPESQLNDDGISRQEFAHLFDAA